MPLRGVNKDDPGFTLALLAPEGAIPSTPFDNVQPVGAVYASVHPQPSTLQLEPSALNTNLQTLRCKP